MLQALVLVLQGGTPAQVRDVDAYTSTAILLAHTGNLEDRTDNSLFGVPGRHIVFHVVRILRPDRMRHGICNGPGVRKYVLVFGSTTPVEVFHQVGFDHIRATGTTAGTATGTSGQHTLYIVNIQGSIPGTMLLPPDIQRGPQISSLQVAQIKGNLSPGVTCRCQHSITGLPIGRFVLER